MTIPAKLEGHLSLPLIAAPMFLLSQPELVLASCKNGVIGTFPSLNARPIEQLDTWLSDMTAELDKARADNPDKPIAPYGVNLIVHKSNTRLAEDIDMVVKHKVPVVITSVGAPGDVVERVHAYGGLVFHDVINLRHAKKAAGAGVDGLILVAAGAGGHGGLMNPFTFIPQVREFFDGTILLAGALSNGNSIRAAETLGADMAYMGTRFIATNEAFAEPEYKDMICRAEAKDIIYTDKVSGIMGNFMRESLEEAGMTPEDLGVGPAPKTEIKFDEAGEKRKDKKAWKTVWSAGQGVGEIKEVIPVADLVSKLKAEYEEAVKLPSFK
jgi:nitronate monooxygenase